MTRDSSRDEGSEMRLKSRTRSPYLARLVVSHETQFYKTGSQKICAKKYRITSFFGTVFSNSESNQNFWAQ